MALRYSKILVDLKEVDLKNKPDEMLLASAKATVPVLIISNGKVIDESIEIMRWSLKYNDPQNWLQPPYITEINDLIQNNDTRFKLDLDQYKYADRFPEHALHVYRQRGESTLHLLEQRLNQQAFLVSNTLSLADIALFPFIRQFAYVDIQWFEQSPYPKLRHWLDSLLESELFLSIMKK